MEKKKETARGGVKLEAKLLVLLGMVVASVLTALYAGFVEQVTIVYTHFFYIPILLAGMWYRRKEAVAVALFLGIVHILITYFSPAPLTANEFGRAAIFVLVAYVIGYVSEQRAEREDAVREREERYSTFLDSTSELSFLKDDQFRFILVNKALSEYFGKKAEEIIGKTDFDFMPEPAAEQCRNTDKKAIAAGTVVVTEEQAGDRILETLKFPVRLGDNKIGVGAYIRDITEQKRMEDALRESEEKVRLVTDQITDVVWSMDLKENFTFVTPSIERITGYTVDEIRSLTFNQLLTPESYKTAMELINQRMKVENHKPVTMELEQICKDGSRVWCEITAIFVVDQNNRPTGIVGVTRDINERKQAEEAMRESEKRYRSLFEDSPIALWLEDFSAIKNFFDSLRASGVSDFRAYSEHHPEVVATCATQMKVLDVNVATLTLYNARSKEELLGGLTSIFVPESFDAFRENLIALLEGKTDFEIEAINQTLTGEMLDLIVQWSVLPGYEDSWSRVLVSSVDITDRKRAEAALRESEAQLSNAMEIAQLGYWEYDVAKDLFTFNDHFYAIFRTSAEQVGGYTMSSARYAQLFVHPDDREVVGIEIRKAIETTDPHFSRQLEHRIIYADGEIGYITVRFFILKDNQGRTVKTYGANQDITERKRMEDELRRSETLYRTFFEATGVPTVILDEDGTFYQVNAEGAKISGFTKEELEGKKSWTEFIAKKEDLEMMREIHRLRRTDPDQAPMNYEFLFKDRYGNLRNIYVTATLIPGTKRSVVSFADLTERKRAEDALKESEKKYRTFVDTASDLMLIADKDGKITDVNQSMARTLRYSGEELLGMPITQLLSKESLEKDFKPNWEEFITEGKISLGTTFATKDGEEIYGEIKVVAVYDSDGEYAGSRAVFRDLTERKQAEEERDRILKELEAKNRELERFTYTVSHDLRSPLVTIQGFTGMLQNDLERDNKEKAKTDLQYIANATTKMDRLLRDTLQLSRIGRIANPPEDVPFGAIVQDALEQTTEQIKSSGVEVSVAEDLPTVHVDRMRIAEVLVNLIGNSVRYRGEQPHPKIEIGYRTEDKETVFFVKDNGIGIDKTEHEKVFELFYRVDAHGEGSGAGLAIVKRIIEVHGGRIWMESEIGKGTTVCFTLLVV
ncbi:MAG: PAS domain S-box protein [Methanomicrobia archaeon]|nr:PAS domain S-box protein [Methanomicrobia archaeon]